MAQIVINEISSNYTYNIGTNSYATVALPITASWGPCFGKIADDSTTTIQDMLDATAWEKFPATQAGLEAFVSTYRGPATNYRLTGDYSYQNAITLLTAGYDVLVCRLCPGTPAQGNFYAVNAYNSDNEYTSGDIFCYYAPSASGKVSDGVNMKAKSNIPAIPGGIKPFRNNVEYEAGSYVDYEGIIYTNGNNIPVVDAFDNKTIYSVGNLVSKDGAIYQCITATSSVIPEFSNSTKYESGSLVKKDGVIYQCNDVVPSGVNAYSDSTEYLLGDIVSVNGVFYQCVIPTKQAIAPFSSSTEYSANDLVVYENLVYQCTTSTKDSIPAFNGSNEYSVDDLTVYNGMIYQCTTATKSAIPAFSNSATYAVGDIVIENDVIYQCTTAVPSNVNAYDDTASYNVGDLCTYNDTIYQCIEATTGEWDSTKWTTDWSKAFDASDWTTSWTRQFVASEWTTNWSKAFDADDWTTNWHKEFDSSEWTTSWSKDFEASDWTTDWSRDFIESEWTTAWSKEFNASDWTAVVEPAKDTDYSNVPNFLHMTAKYPGSFGNNLKATLTQNRTLYDYNYWNLIVYVIDSTGRETAVENIVFTADEHVSMEHEEIPFVDEVESKFVTISVVGDLNNVDNFGRTFVRLSGGDDREAEYRDGAEIPVEEIKASAVSYARERYGDKSHHSYVEALENAKFERTEWVSVRYREWLYLSATGHGNMSYTDGVYSLLTDKLTYNPDRIISPSWDDQDFTQFDMKIGETDISMYDISPIHQTIMSVAADSRCATGFIDVPRSISRSQVMDYAEKLATSSSVYQFATHSTFWAPWGHFTYSGTGKASVSSPSFMKHIIERAQISNQSIQYSWALPTNRKHNVVLGKLDYIVPKKVLDVWQSGEGVNINVITNIPDLGTNTWGNSTLWAIPPATYNALENLSTRLLVNALKDTAYRVGIGITFQYNNSQSYSKFYAGMAPLLDTMQNVGAIDDYRIVMSADINGLDSVRANSVIGKIYITCNGVINDVFIDLIALPSSVDLNTIVV